MIQEAKSKSNETIEKAKESAHSEAEKITFEAETNAKKEAYHITNKTNEKVEITKSKATGMVDEAAEIIVKSIL
jgi:V/A-type H+-transporting ATPase subunit G/H